MENVIEVNGRTFTKESIINILESRVVIEKPGKYQVKARQITPYTPEGKSQRFIVNLQATTPFMVNRTLEAVKKGDFQTALNQNLTATVFENEGKHSTYLPQPGEEVSIIVKNHVNKQGETMLIVDSIVALATIEAKSAKGLFASAFEVKSDLDAIAEEAKLEKVGTNN